MRFRPPSPAAWLASLALSLPLASQDLTAARAPVATGFLARSLTLDGNDHRYVVFVPPDYTPTAKWPLCVFLNGAGECGTDGWSQVSVGLGPAIMAHVERWPFVVVFPQKPDRASAWEDHDAMVLAMLAATEREFAIDADRRFLTGLSQGGHGTWVLGARHRDRWSAIAPVCGYADGDAIAQDLAAMPIWCFHGEDDQAVSVQQSKDLTAAIAAAGGSPRLTLYPGVGHDSWVRAYRDEPVAAWLLVARSEPLLARYLAEPAAITSAQIAIAVGGPDGGGQRGTIAFAGDAVTWRLDSISSFEASDVRPDRQGELRAPHGRRHMSNLLGRLALGGCFAAPRTPPPATLPTFAEIMDGTPALAVSIDGVHGAWRFRHRSSDGATASHFGDRLRSVLEALGHLPR